MECPVCNVKVDAYITFGCTHSLCNQCVLNMLNRNQSKCPLCRTDFINSVPKIILDEVVRVEDPGYDSTDEIDERATHVKIRYGQRDIAYVPNDGKIRHLYFEDGLVKFRIECRGRKFYLIRHDDPSAGFSLHPLRGICVPSAVQSVGRE